MEARISRYRKDNAALIETNIQRDESYAVSLREQEEADRKQREARARALAFEEEEERALREAGRLALLDSLEHSNSDASALVAKSQRELARRQREKARAAESAGAMVAPTAKALRSRVVLSAVPDVPHVPLEDDWYAYEDLYVVRAEGYHDPMSEAVRKDREGIMRGGGYRVEEAWERAIRCAVAGLDLVPLEDIETSAPSPLPADADVVMASVT